MMKSGAVIRMTTPINKEAHLAGGLEIFIYPRSVHICREVTLQVLPPLRGLTAVFGMGTGVSLSP